MIFNFHKLLAIAAIAPLSLSINLLHRALAPEPSVAIADTLFAPPPGMDHQTLLAKAEKAAQQGKYDTAIINYRRAKRIAYTGCDLGLAAAGEIAALEAKEWITLLKTDAPEDAAENADMAYNRRFRQAKKSIVDGMFCASRSR
jgi:hypothetical protein